MDDEQVDQLLWLNFVEELDREQRRAERWAEIIFAVCVAIGALWALGYLA